MAKVARVVALDFEGLSSLLKLTLLFDAAGVLELSALRTPRVAIHVGRPVRLECKHGDEQPAGLAIRRTSCTYVAGRKIANQPSRFGPGFVIRVKWRST
jgi:hypothetical protein